MRKEEKIMAIQVIVEIKLQKACDEFMTQMDAS